MQLESWAAPEYSRGRVNAASATLVDAAASPEARREAHGWPLEVLQGRLTDKGPEVGDPAHLQAAGGFRLHTVRPVP